MATFKYIARDNEGAEQQGSLVADSQTAAVRVLDDRGLFPVRLWEDRPAAVSLGIVGRVRLSRLGDFYNQLGDLLAAGVPILRALDLLSRQRASGALPMVLGELREDVAGGAGLADAMEKHTLAFPELHVGMVRAGEQGGFLEQVLHRLARFVEQRDQLRNRVIVSLIYPVFLLVFGVAVAVVLVAYFMPRLEPILANVERPFVTDAVMYFGRVVHGYFWLIGLAAVPLAVLILLYIHSPTGRRSWDRIQLRLPTVGSIFLMVAICRFCRVLGTLLRNGVSMLAALNISRDSTGNSVLSDLIAEGAEAVRGGKSLAQTFRESGMFPDDVVDIIAVGEQTNRLDSVLIEVADRHEERLGRKVETAVRMLEPVMLLVVFGMVFIIALALLLPILNMSLAGPELGPGL